MRRAVWFIPVLVVLVAAQVWSLPLPAQVVMGLAGGLLILAAEALIGRRTRESVGERTPKPSSATRSPFR